MEVCIQKNFAMLLFFKLLAYRGDTPKGIDALIVIFSLFAVFPSFLDDFQIDFSSNFWKNLSKFLTSSSRFFNLSKNPFWPLFIWIAASSYIFQNNYYSRYDWATGTENQRDWRWGHCPTFGVNILFIWKNIKATVSQPGHYEAPIITERFACQAFIRTPYRNGKGSNTGVYANGIRDLYHEKKI